jgi:hypothetical protein
LKAKDTSKDNPEFTKAKIALIQYILFTLEESAIHQHSKPEDPIPTLIGLDLPMTTLIGIARKRKPLLTCT